MYFDPYSSVDHVQTDCVCADCSITCDQVYNIHTYTSEVAQYTCTDLDSMLVYIFLTIMLMIANDMNTLPLELPLHQV